MPKSIKPHSSSVKSVAAASEVGLQSGDGEALVACWRSHCRKISKSKVVGCRSLGSTPRFPPPISRKMGGGGDKVDTTTRCTIRKLAHFLQEDMSTPIHLFSSSGPGDCGKAVPKLVQQKRVWVHSLSPMDLDDSNPDPAASDILLVHHLNDTDQSQPTPCHHDVIIIMMTVWLNWRHHRTNWMSSTGMSPLIFPWKHHKTLKY